MSERDVQAAVKELLAKHGIRYAENASGNAGLRGKRAGKPGLRIPDVDSAGPDLIVAPGGIRVFRARSVFEAYAAVQEAREGWLSVYGLELKSSHPDKCRCKSCTAQREWAERMRPR